MMRLYVNEKEVPTLRLALALLVDQGGDIANVAQALLARIDRCLELQGNNDRTAANGSKR